MATKIGIIGAGYWGPNLIRNFNTLPGADLLMVCDLADEKLEKIAGQYPNIRTTTNYLDIISDSAVEAVVVSTPAENHCQSVMEALTAGKHVFVEKPLATNSADAELMVRKAEEKGLILMVGHIFLFQSAIEQMISLVNKGDIGDIRYAHGVRTSMAGTARLDTNIVWDALVHDAYILPAIFGKSPERVRAVGGCYLSPDLEDVAYVTFDFGDGRLAQVYASWYALEKTRQITVIGADGILKYDDLAPSPLVRYDRRYEQGADLDPNGRPRWHWHDADAQAVALEAAEPLKGECQHFLDCITKGQKPKSDGWSGLQSIHILEACQRSLENDNGWQEV